MPLLGPIGTRVGLGHRWSSPRGTKGLEGRQEPAQQRNGGLMEDENTYSILHTAQVALLRSRTPMTTCQRGSRYLITREGILPARRQRILGHPAPRQGCSLPLASLATACGHP
jgi:hypothetical protein